MPLSSADATQIADTIKLIGAIVVAILTVAGSIVTAVAVLWYRHQAEVAKVRKDLATAQTRAAEEMPGQVGTQIADKLKEQLGSFFEYHVERTNRLSDQMTTLRNDLTVAQTDRANLARDLSTLRDQNTQDRKRWEAEILVRDQQIDDLTKRADSLQAAITDKDGKLTNAHSTITALREELQAAHEDLETTQAGMGKLEERVLVLEGQVNALSAERATIIAERDQALQDRDAIKLERDTQSQEIQRLSAIVSTQAELIESLLRELETLRVRLASMPPAVTSPDPVAVIGEPPAEGVKP